jgi:hypothetical protein
MCKAQFKNKSIVVSILIIAGLCSTQFAEGTVPSAAHLWISNPYWRVGRIEQNNPGFDAAGFSDNFYWGISPRHNFNEHEMLSGEWAAAAHLVDDAVEGRPLIDAIPSRPTGWVQFVQNGLNELPQFVADFPNGGKRFNLTFLFCHPWFLSRGSYGWLSAKTTLLR